MAEKGIAPGLSVVGYGIWSALGPDGPSTIAGIRGQIIGSETGNLWDPTVGANLNCFRVAAHQWWEGPSFLPDLATPPIEECLAQVATLPATLRRPASEIPILVTVAPPDRPGRAVRQIEPAGATGMGATLINQPRHHLRTDG